MQSLTINALRDRLATVWQPNGIEMKIIGHNVPELCDIFPINFDTVEKLVFSDSKIVRIQSNTFRRLGHLTDLNLEKNELNGNELEFLKPVQTLTKLALNENRLKSFANVNLRNLEELNLADNHIESFKQNNLPKLRKLVLTNNRLTELHAKMFESFTELIILTIESNQVHFVEKRCFCPLQKLRVLNLAANQLNKWPKHVFGPVNDLSELNLSGNQFVKLGKDIFDGLVNLDELDLSANKLIVVDPVWFKHLGHLTTLNLSRNRFEDLNRKCLANLTNLEYFKVESNFWTIDVIRSDMFEMNRLLVEVDFCNSKISEIASGTFSNLFYLKVLDLSKNYLTKLPEMFLPQNYSLEFLSLTSNRLKSISANCFASGNIGMFFLGDNQNLVLANDFFKNIYEIEELHLQNIWFSDRLQTGMRQWIFPDLSHLKSLELINLSENSILEFPDNYFHPFVNLKTLLLGSNFSQSSNCLSSGSSIEERVRRTYMKKMKSKHLIRPIMSIENQLEQLVLKKCDIKTIGDQIFAGLRHLKILDLTGNRIKTLTASVFRDLASLELLLLGDNFLKELRCDVFESNTNLKILNISLNYFRTIPKCVFVPLRRLRKLTVDVSCDIPNEILQSRGVNVVLFEPHQDD